MTANLAGRANQFDRIRPSSILKSPSEKRLKMEEDQQSQPSINIFDTEVYIKNDDFASKKGTSRHRRGNSNYASLKTGGEANKENIPLQFFNIGTLNKTDKFKKIVVGENIKKAGIKAHHLRFTADPTDPEHDVQKDRLLQQYAGVKIEKEENEDK